MSVYRRTGAPPNPLDLLALFLSTLVAMGGGLEARTMPSSRRHILLTLAAALALTGCVGTANDQPISDDSEDDGTDAPPPPDNCNTPDDARNVADCQLQLGVERIDYIGLLGDVDWYSVTLPQGLTARSLLHVTAGYNVPATGVSLSVNVLENGTTSIGAATDDHGQAAPQPIDMIIRTQDSGAQILIELKDKSGQYFDWRNPYALKVEVVDDPDVNEPNDTTPTPIPLAAGGGGLQGQQTGYLATTNDVDIYSFTVPTANQVVYFHVSAPELSPPPPFRVSYTLKDGTGTAVAQGVMTNQYLAVDLATARIGKAETYTLEVTGYRNQPLEKTPGDLRLKYTVDVLVLPELDTNEPNDTYDTAKVQSLGSPGASASIKGRIGHVPDPDWYAFDLPANSAPTTFYYHLTPGAGPGRFPALPGALDRHLRVFTEVSQGTNSCKSDRSVCPRRDDATTNQIGDLDAYCGEAPAKCMWSARQEDLKYGQLRNFEGAIPVPPHSGTVRYYLLMEDDETDWADDVEYTLDVTWRPDADEASRFSGGSEQTQVNAMAVDGAAATFPMPPTGGQFELTGTLSYGDGYWRNNDPLQGEGVRAHDDYDSTSSDEDTYELDFPAGMTGDQTWELEWEIEKPSGGGTAPYDIALDVTFCDGSGGAGSCQQVDRTLGYTGGNLGSWHSAGVAGAPFQPVYSLEDMSDRVRVTALAWGCFCIEPRFMLGGKMFIKVVAVDREGYADTPYHIRTGLTSYPKPYNGGMCPAATATSPGCKFTE